MVKVIDNQAIEISEHINGTIHTILFQFRNVRGDLHTISGMSWNDAGKPQRKRPNTFSIKNRFIDI